MEVYKNPISSDKKSGVFIYEAKMKNYLIIVVWLSLLAFSSPAIAETKTFLKEYTYQATEYDSKVSCRALALDQVKRLLLEELGAYLESETEVKNSQLTKDQIVMLTAGLVRAEIIDERWNGKTYYLKAKIAADPKDVANSIEKLRQDRQKTKELEETRKKADEALRDISKLRKELEIAKAEKSKFDQYINAVNRLSATDLFEKGYALAGAGRNQEAIGIYTSAIELNPKFAIAYFGRGFAYGELGDHRQAIRDYEKVIELNPKFADGYCNRGLAYGKLGDLRQAIRDFDRAIELDPGFPLAYSNRGVDYTELGDHRQAIRDFDRAIELDAKYAMAYCNRGASYGKLRENRQAIRDYDRAIKLDPKYALAYYNRGFVVSFR